MLDTHADYTELQPLLSMLGEKTSEDFYILKQEQDDETLDPKDLAFPANDLKWLQLEVNKLHKVNFFKNATGGV